MQNETLITKQVEHLKDLLKNSVKSTLVKNKSKPIVVTGGMGFIGSNLIRYLNALGYTNIFIVDNVMCEEDKAKDKLLNIRDLKFASLIDKSNLNELYNQLKEFPSMVFLFGASSNTSTSCQLAFENYKFNKELVETFPDSIIIFASSAATYGAAGQNVENALPQSPYAIYKHSFDLYLESKRNNYYRDSSAKLFSFKFFNVFGPYEFHKSCINMDSPVLKVFNNAINNSSSSCYDFDKLIVMRDFIYIYDALYLMFCNIFENEAGTKRVFDIGYGRNTTFDYIMKEAAERIPYQTEIIFRKIKEISPYYQSYTKASPKLGICKTNLFFDIKKGVSHYAKFFNQEKKIRYA